MTEPDKRIARRRPTIPVRIESPFEPATLVPIAEDLRDEVGWWVKALGALRPQLDRLAQAELTPRAAISVISKVTRALTDAAKALDGVTRLASFLAGQADHRVEQMDKMSDAELQDIVRGALRTVLRPEFLARRMHEALRQLAAEHECPAPAEPWAGMSANYQALWTASATKVLEELPLAA